MESEGQGTTFPPNPALSSHSGQKENFFRSPDTVSGDNLATTTSQLSKVSENKGKNILNIAKKDTDGEEKRTSDEKAMVGPPKTSVKPENQVPAPGGQKFTMEPLKPNITPSSYRSQAPDNIYRTPAPSGQVRPPINQVNPGVPNQFVRIQQPYPSQPRPLQIPPNTSPHQPSPPPPAHLPMQLNSPRPNVPYQNPAIQVSVQRPHYPGQTYNEFSQQNRPMNPGQPRPSLTQPMPSRPQIYQSSQMQRMPQDGFHKIPNMQQIRPNNQMMPQNNYQYPPKVPSNTAPAVGVPANASERIYKAEPSAIDSPKVRVSNPIPNVVVDPRPAPPTIAKVPDQNINIPLELSQDVTKPVQKNGEPKANTESTHDVKPENKSQMPTGVFEVSVAEDKPKDEKEQGIVLANVKFFEERDIAKTPLTPKVVSPVKPVPPGRSGTFVRNNVVKGEILNDKSNENGVDETSLLNISRFFDANRRNPKSRDRCDKNNYTKSKYGVNSSCPSTPLKLPLHKRDERAWDKSRASSKSHKSIFEFSPEEELLYFFNIAKASYHKCFDRNHMSRIDDTSHRKENIPTANGDVHAVKKTPSRLPAAAKRSSSASSPTKTPLRSPSVPKSLPKTPDSPAPQTPLIKKVPMNKIQVGAAPSPNLKAVRSKIGSLANTTHKPGGGNIKIESHKVDFSKTQPRIAAKNDTYAPGGGDKKIQQVKLQWSAKPKVGSLENASHKPGGGDKKIESVKLDFKDKAKPKVGSKDNVKHVPGGGAVKNHSSPPEWKSMDIESQKLEFKAQSKVGSLDNVKHKPGGGDVKIFDDKTYLKQISCGSSEGRASGTQSYCDLSVVSEVHSVSAPGTPHHGTAIKIKKSTTLGNSKSDIRKTTEVTVISRSPSNERKNLPKSSSLHEVKLTYAKVASPKHKQPGSDVGPVDVVRVPANENSAILRPDDTPIEVKNLITSFEQQITNNKGLLFDKEGKNYPKTRPEPVQEIRTPGQINEELTQRFIPVKEELNRITQEKKAEENVTAPKEEEGETISKFLKNEMAAHEKVGEIWKEVHNISPDKPNSESVPPPPTPTVTQKPGFQQTTQQNLPPSIRPQAPRSPGPRPANLNPQQMNLQRPPQMQIPQRLPFPQQMRSPIAGPQGLRQTRPEFNPASYTAPQRVSPGDAAPSSLQQTSPSQGSPLAKISPSSP